MAEGAPDRPVEDEDRQSSGSIVSELHQTLQALLVQLYEAGGPGQRGGVAQAQARAQDISRAGRNFEHLVGALPPEVRCWRADRLQEEFEALQRQDAEIGEEVARWSERVAGLQRSVAASVRSTCEELCGGTASAPSREEEAEAGRQAASSAAEPQPRRKRPAACLGAKPRLQDLVQERSRRFVEELEFVQCLASPEYVHWLASQRYFEDEAFIEFLNYLNYWRHPPHVHHVVYPQALRMLELLQDPVVRGRLHRLDTRSVLLSQMMWKWSSDKEVDVPRAVAEAPKASSSSSSTARPGPVVEPPPPKHAADILREVDVLQDWTALTGVLADKAWHEKVDKINPSIYTIQHDARAIGVQYLSRSLNGGELNRAAVKYAHFWADDASPCDLGKVLKAPQKEALTKGLQVPARALERLAPRSEQPVQVTSPPAPNQQQMVSHQPARKRGRRA